MAGDVGKYVKLAVMSSINQSRSLSEMGILWYGENGRFYKERALREIQQAEQAGILIKDGSKYRANVSKIVGLLCSDVKGRDATAMIRFWSHPFSLNTYFSAENLRIAFSNADVAGEADLIRIFTLPLILHSLEESNSQLYSLFVTGQGLEEYTKAINCCAQDNLDKYFKNLKEKTDWLENLDQIAKGDLFKNSQAKLEVRGLVRKSRWQN